MRFYGMSSRAAMDKHAGGVANYRASEGKEVLLDYRGPVDATVQEILGGVRSACTYVGAGGSTVDSRSGGRGRHAVPAGGGERAGASSA
jgi:IMP dehydrogenase/GMP reductase